MTELQKQPLPDLPRCRATSTPPPPPARARRRAAATAAASQAQGLYRTGFADYDVRNYIWRELPAVDPRAHFLASSFALFGADMDEMMNSR